MVIIFIENSLFTIGVQNMRNSANEKVTMKKRFFNSHASMIRCLLIVLTMVFLNILFIWSGFLKTDNVLTPVSRVVVHYSGVIFISIGGLILCYETYINKSSCAEYNR
jgi:hypothetical protein